MGSGKTDRPSEKSEGTGKDPGQDLRRGICRETIFFEKTAKRTGSPQADVRMLVNAAGYGKIGNVSDIDLKEQCGMVDLNCTHSPE